MPPSARPNSGDEQQKGDHIITSRDTPEQDNQDPPDRLDGWKRIAAFLGKDVRTLRRWERNEGLPIHRLMHDKQGTVYAFRSELETWRSTRGQTPAFDQPGENLRTRVSSRVRVIGVVALLIVVVAVIAWWQTGQPVANYNETDWVLITQFDNRTGESELDGTLEYAMERELSNSRYVRVLPRFRINDVLQLMQLPPESRIDGETGREISLRDGEVRFLINGRIEKLGDTYTLYSDLVTPRDGVIRSSYAREIRDATGILSAISQIAGEIRKALGEESGSIERSEEELAMVTTPSLRALKLYSEAETMMMGVDRNRAVPVLQQALRIDPEFASAHLLLWYALRDRDQMTQAMSHLQSAVELAENTTERERLFILATYYQFFLEDIPRAIETFELLARLYPDHFWAVSNLASLNETLGYHERAYPFQLRRADLRPGVGWSMLEAARAAAIYGDDEMRARYSARARESTQRTPWMAPHIDLLPYQTQWLDGEFESLGLALDRWTTELEWDDLDDEATERYMVRSLYLGLGDLAGFRALTQQTVDGDWLPALVDFDGGDPSPLKRHLDLAPTTFWTATLLAMTGRTDEARSMLDDPEAAQNTRQPYVIRYWKNLAAGELALAEDRCDDAIVILGESIPNVRFRSKRHFLFGAMSLAMAYACREMTDDAIATLEQARREKQWSVFDYGATYLWYRNQLYLRDLYKQIDQSANAAAIEEEIGSMLVIAQPDFPIRSLLDRD